MASAIFPIRAIRVKPPKQASLLSAVATCLICLALAGGMVWWQAPDLIKDYQINGNVEPATGARLIRAKCSSKLIFHMCDAEIAHRVADERRTTSQGFGFVDFKIGSYTTSILQAKNNPAVVTTSLALESLWNRMLTAGGLLALLIAGVFGGLKAIVSAHRENSIFGGLDDTKLTPVLVDVYGYNDDDAKKKIWYYGLPENDPEKAFSVIYDPKRLPFFLNEEGTKGLAITSPTAKQPLLLDHAMTYLTLKDEERNNLMGWRQSLLERQAARLKAEGQNVQPIDEQGRIRPQAA
jgi:hypothetical protein